MNKIVKCHCICLLTVLEDHRVQPLQFISLRRGVVEYRGMNKEFYPEFQSFPLAASAAFLLMGLISFYCILLLA